MNLKKELTPKFKAAGIDLNRITGILYRTGQREKYVFSRVYSSFARGEQSGVPMEQMELWAGFEVAMHLNKHLFPGGPDGTPVEGQNPFWTSFKQFDPEDLLILAHGGSLTVPMRTMRLVKGGVPPRFLTALPLVGADDRQYWKVFEILGHVPPEWIEGVLGSSDETDAKWKVMLKSEARQLARLHDDGVPVEYARHLFDS